MKFFAKRIIRNGDSIYMIRRTIFGCRWFSIHLHHILRSDSDRVLHDHPWDFISVIIWRGYTEWTYQVANCPLTVKLPRWHGIGSVLFRRAEHFHRVTMTKPMWSLVFCGPRRRTWGFQTNEGWVDWRTYLGLDQNTKDES